MELTKEQQIRALVKENSQLKIQLIETIEAFEKLQAEVEEKNKPDLKVVEKESA